MTKRVEFKVAFDLPKDCTVAHARETLEDQVSAMGGNLRPPGGYCEDDEGDPMFGFHFNEQNASVTRIRKTKR
jgi:hypothetical protein